MFTRIIKVSASILLLAGAAGALLALAARAGQPPAFEDGKFYSIPVQPMAGDTRTSGTLAPYRGKVLLIVNVASKCGFTPQYAGLEKIYRQYKDRGFVVLGFPANDFKNQEPGTEAEIMQFCKANYGVTFPIYGKIHVIGGEKAPLYKHLTPSETPDVKWNFEKFLIGADGRVVARFPSKVKPDSKDVTEAIEKALNDRPRVINGTYDPSNGTASVCEVYRYKQ